GGALQSLLLLRVSSDSIISIHDAAYPSAYPHRLHRFLSAHRALGRPWLCGRDFDVRPRSILSAPIISPRPSRSLTPSRPRGSFHLLKDDGGRLTRCRPQWIRDQ